MGVGCRWSEELYISSGRGCMVCTGDWIGKRVHKQICNCKHTQCFTNKLWTNTKKICQIQSSLTSCKYWSNSMSRNMHKDILTTDPTDIIGATTPPVYCFSHHCLSDQSFLLPNGPFHYCSAVTANHLPCFGYLCDFVQYGSIGPCAA